MLNWFNTKTKKAVFDFCVTFAVTFFITAGVDTTPEAAELVKAAWVGLATTVVQLGRRYAQGE